MPAQLRVFGLLVVLVWGGGVGPVQAERRAHRPWFSKNRPSQAAPKTASRPIVSSQQKAARQDANSRIAEQALKYKGTKYRFGGNSREKGVDCSGLVQRVIYDVKSFRLPRTSQDIYSMGTPVSMRDLRPGDLVFFKNTYRPGISHVGIYVGKNRFIHAPNKRRPVSLTQLSEPYYQLRYAGARRLF